MRAAVLERFGSPLRIEERPEPVPRAGEVLVKVRASGICRSDLRVLDGAFPDVELPRVLGHEIAGHAEGIGEVLVYGSWGCGICSWCLRDEESLCPNASEPGWTRDGGHAEYVVVPSTRFLVPLRGLDPVRAAPLADAGLSAYRAVRRGIPWLVEPSTAVVIGAGALGQFAIQYLKALTGATVLAIDPSPTRRRRALELGADQATALPRISSDERRETAQAVFDFWGSDQTLQLGLGLVRRAGVLVQVGADGGSSEPTLVEPPHGRSGGRVYFGMGLVPREVSLTTSVWGSYRDLRRVLDLAQSGLLQWDVEAVPLDAANEAMARLRRGQVRGRLVLTP